MNKTEALIQQMREVAPPGQQELDDGTRGELTRLTADLLASRPESAEEFERYLAVQKRSLDLPLEEVRSRIRGRTIIVTGGTGCIGTVLLEQLAGFEPARLVSVGITPPERSVEGVEYVYLDIRNGGSLERLFGEIQPDIVFHLAAQRDPGLAEREVHRTASTNVIGTRKVAEAAERTGVEQLVCASTGKAVRPYASDIYAASKRVSESLLANAAARGRVSCSGVRFTHVVDNSILLGRLEEWCRNGEIVHLHSADIAFYTQSALEASQLMLCAALAPRDDSFRLHAIRNLGWPSNLLDLALGIMEERGTVAPLHISGFDPGYEEKPYPGLYDPASAGEVSPLISAFEAPRVEPAPNDAVDCFTVPACNEPNVTGRLRKLERLCQETSAGEPIREALDDFSCTLLDKTLRETPSPVLRRIARFTVPYRESMTDEHLSLDDAVRYWAGDELPLDNASRVGQRWISSKQVS